MAGRRISKGRRKNNNHEEVKIVGFDFPSALKVFSAVYLVLSLLPPTLIGIGYFLGIKEYVDAVNAAGFSVFFVVFLFSFFGGLVSFSLGLLVFNFVASRHGVGMKYER